MPNDLLKLLALEANEIDAAFKKASLEGYGTPQEIADRREGIMSAFFTKYFPFPFRIVKGNIIDSYGQRSASIDCIILDPSHPYTIDAVNQKASVILADGVDYAIEIKSNLSSKEEIERALHQIHTVKKLTRVRHGVVLGDVNENDYKIPCLIYTHETYKDAFRLLKGIVDYYDYNKIKRIYQFDILASKDIFIINSKGYPIHIREGNGLYSCTPTENNLGFMLFLMSKYRLVQPRLNEDVLEIYLKGIKFKYAYSPTLNTILNDIENK